LIQQSENSCSLGADPLVNVDSGQIPGHVSRSLPGI
jgi:hypothetical protein